MCFENKDYLTLNYQRRRTRWQDRLDQEGLWKCPKNRKVATAKKVVLVRQISFTFWQTTKKLV